MTSGIIAINKPSGISSFDAVREIRKILTQDHRKIKIGHGGTLDIPADGVLPILLGEATKAFDYLLNSNKTYRAVVQFGSFTETDDAEGNPIEIFGGAPTRDAVEAVIPEFIGLIEQLPPRYSALRIDGRRSYQLARENQEIELKPRKVHIESVTLDSFNQKDRQVNLTIICSSGTYIRSIARDMGRLLSCGGHILRLTRTRSAGIDLSDCIGLDNLDVELILKSLIPLRKGLSMPELNIRETREWVMNGRPLQDSLFLETEIKDGEYKVVHGEELFALIERKGRKYSYLRVFHE